MNGSAHTSETSNKENPLIFIIYPKKFLIASNDASNDAMTTSQDMDEIDLFGKKLPKQAQLLKF